MDPAPSATESPALAELPGPIATEPLPVALDPVPIETEPDPLFGEVL